MAAIYGADGRFHNGGFEPISEKLTRAAALPRRSHTINAADYPTVYVTSDIHADLRKFTQILLSSGLITTPFKADFDPYTDDIYDPRFIAEAQWSAPRGTLLVIIGDLVDGKRGFGRGTGLFNQVPDPRGSFEFLIFALLYNLRIQANATASEIRFTMGNHELSSIIHNVVPDEYLPYVHDTAINFFTNPEMPWSELRRAVIISFLELCPYYTVVLQHGGANEVAFVHGGLHAMVNMPASASARYRGAPAQAVLQGLSGRIRAFQSEIDSGVRTIDDVSPIVQSDPNGVLWTRFYASTAAGVCHTLSPDYRLILVGHCVTSSNFPRFTELKRANDLYRLCDDGERIEVGGLRQEKGDLHGCVLLDCAADRDDDMGAPRLGFVDTAMSGCQHLPNSAAYAAREIPHAPRIVQIMRLTHTDRPSVRFYNRIERVLSPTGAVELLYEVPAAAGGGKQTRKKTQRTRTPRKTRHSKRSALKKLSRGRK